MKKLICTVIVMATMITTAGAVAPAKTFGSVCKNAANAQMKIETMETTDSWGLPMTITKINLFGCESVFEYARYNFE